jgi:hypothetical protein
MAAIINALFGTYPEPEQQNITTDSNQTVVQQSAIGNECLHTSAVVDNVHVKSVISSETQANAAINTKLNIDALLAQLNTTHAQVDQYSQSHTAEINEQVQKAILAVLEDTKRQQDELLSDANRRHLIIDNEYSIQLRKAVEALDNVKAQALSSLEHDLHGKQQLIMSEAKKQIDHLNDQANAAKLNILVEAQEQAKLNIDSLTEQAIAVGQHDTENLLQSTTTTVITSQAQASGAVVAAPVIETAITTNEQQATTIANNQMQVAIRSPMAVVLAPSSPPPTNPTTVADAVTAPTESAPASTVSSSTTTTTQESTTVVNTVNPVSDQPTQPLEHIPATVPTDVTGNSNTVETEFKPSPDNTTF